MSKKTSIGGQALIEGIMMKGPNKTAMAVRKPDKEIEIIHMDEHHIKDKIKFLGYPVLRGMVNLIESMIEGYKALMLSAEKSGFAELEEENGAKTEPEAQPEAQAETEVENKPEEQTENAKADKVTEEKSDNAALMNVLMVVASVLGVVLAMVLFMLLPRYAVDLIKWLAHTDFTPVIRSSIEQLIKLAVFVIYIWAVSKMPDIKRVFMYHGAEHKTIFCYEKGLPLTVENVRKQIRFHPRCGTSFMILMILISIVFSTLVQMIFPAVYGIRWLWVVVKILLIPLTCGAGYELLKICGRHDNAVTRAIATPGLWVQRLTTKEPTDDMIEVAISAVKEVIPENPEEDVW